MIDKHARLLKLARLRQESRWPGYRCIGDYCKRRYECDFVSPYTRSAGNVDAELMILLQDWSSDEVLSGPYLHARCTVGRAPADRDRRALAGGLPGQGGVRRRGACSLPSPCRVAGGGDRVAVR